MVFPQAESAVVPDLPAQRGRAARVVLRPGRRVRRRLDGLPAAVGQRRVQPDAMRRARCGSSPSALEFVAFLLGGINFMTTAMNSRAPGMRMFDIPIVVWMIVIASILFMASVGPLIAGAVMLLFDQTLGTAFFDPGTRRRPDPLAAPVLVLRPPGGLRRAAARRSASSPKSSPVFSRKKLFAYRTVAVHGLRHGRAQLLRLGAPPVHRRHRPAHGERRSRSRRCSSRFRSPRCCSSTSPRCTAARSADDADALGAVVRGRVPDRRRHRHLPRREPARTSTSTTPTSCSRTSTTRSCRSPSSARLPASPTGSRRCSAA